MVDFYMGNMTTIGFFISLIFSVLTIADPFNIVAVTIAITTIFYLIAIGGASVFIHHTDLKEVYNLKRDQIESALDNFINIVEYKEQKIREYAEFIHTLEAEEADLLIRKKEETKAAL